MTQKPVGALKAPFSGHKASCSGHKGGPGFLPLIQGRGHDQSLHHCCCASGTGARCRARAARGRRRTGRGGRRRRAGAGRGSRRGFRRLYRRAFDIAVLGIGSIAFITAPEASLEGQYARREGGSHRPRRRRALRQCAGSHLPERGRRGATPCGSRQAFIPAGPDARLSALIPRRGISRWLLPARILADAPRSPCRRLRPPPSMKRCRAASAASNSAARRSRCDRPD